MKKVRFATIGTSGITENFLRAAMQCPEFELHAVYSRRKETAKAFAGKYGAVKIFDALNELAADEAIDAVYIASPNSLHCEQTLQMLRAGKHVLCEKALASNFAEAEKMVRTAREQGVILLEGMRVLYDPGFLTVRENLHKLGKIRQVSFHFGKYSSKYDDFKAGHSCNIFSREFSAGGLMDIGVYCIEPLLALFGNPARIDAGAVIMENGIDGAGTILAEYKDMIAELSYSKITNLMSQNQITGEDGTMLLSGLVPPRDMEIVYRDGRRETLPWTSGIADHASPHLSQAECENNMVFETDFFIRAVNGEADVKQYQQISLDTMMFMDEVRRKIGLSFPADDSV